MRVFVVGMPKTGTMSMIAALEHIGYRLNRGVSDTQRYYAHAYLHVADGEIVANAGHRDFWYWDFCYPGSVFILQLRDEDSWLASLKDHLTRNIPDSENRRLKRVGVLGIYNFNEDYHRLLYRTHNANVQRYFAGTGRLLVHTTGTDGYRELCKFLDVPTINAPWPHKNARKENMRAASRKQGRSKR